MKKKLFLVIVFLVLPILIYANSFVSTYTETVIKANNYINSFKDRRKYLIFNLLIKDSDKDYKGNKKVYTTNPHLTYNFNKVVSIFIM